MLCLCTTLGQDGLTARLLVVPSESGCPDRRSVTSKEKYSTDSARRRIGRKRECPRPMRVGGLSRVCFC